MDRFRPKYVTFDTHGTLINFQMAEAARDLFGHLLDAPRMDEFIRNFQGYRTQFDAEGLIVTRRAVTLLLLTGQRRSEVAAARVANVDLTRGVWTIPAERVLRDREGASKNGLRHTVPLSPMALEVFKQAIVAAGRSPFVFPSHKTNSAMRGDSITQFLDRLGTRLKITELGAHNLRRTVGQRMRIAGVPVDHRAYVLNHVDEAKSKVTSWNYDPGDHDAEKLAALTLWEASLGEVLEREEVDLPTVELDEPASSGAIACE